MKYLMTQEELEEIIQAPEPSFTAIYFGATWCGPCKRVDVETLDAMPGVQWLKCDIDQNPYTPGYCSIRSIPAFIVIANGKATGPIQSVDTDDIMNWVNDQRATWIAGKSAVKSVDTK